MAPKYLIIRILSLGCCPQLLNSSTRNIINKEHFMAAWLTNMAVKMYDGNLSPVLVHRPQRWQRRCVIAAEHDDPGCRRVRLVGGFSPRDDLKGK